MLLKLYRAAPALMAVIGGVPGGVASQDARVFSALRSRSFSAKIALALALLVMSASAWSQSKKSHTRMGKSVPQKKSLEVIGYFTEGGAATGQYTVKSLKTTGAAGKITVLDYAFGRVVDDRCELDHRTEAIDRAYSATESVSGTADSPAPGTLRGTFHQLQELKREFPKLRIVMSLGGWTGSAGFSSAVRPEQMKKFVHSCVDMFIRGNIGPGVSAPGLFDGIDIDWEYPVADGLQSGSRDDTRNLNEAAREFRRELDHFRPGLLLTAAIPATEKEYSHYDLRSLSHSMDWLSIMAYDMHSNAQAMTDFHSLLFSDDAAQVLASTDPPNRHSALRPSTALPGDVSGDHAVRSFLAAGVPARKIVLGVPFYGKGWAGVADTDHGLHQPASGPQKQEAFLSFAQIAALPPGTDRYFSPRAMSCSVWTENTFYSYDCPQAIAGKMDYIHHRHLGGIMFWQIGQDSPDSGLLNTIQSHIATTQPHSSGARKRSARPKTLQ